MKHLALALVIFAAACTSTTSKKDNGYGTGRDTTRTIVVYVHSPLENLYKVTSAVRFSWDTVMPDPKDKTKNVPVRDTFYNVRIIEKVTDSLGNVLKTTSGRDSMTAPENQWQPLSKNGIIHDYNYNFIPAYNGQMEQLKAAAKRK